MPHYWSRPALVRLATGIQCTSNQLRSGQLWLAERTGVETAKRGWMGHHSILTSVSVVRDKGWKWVIAVRRSTTPETPSRHRLKLIKVTAADIIAVQSVLISPHSLQPVPLQPVVDDRGSGHNTGLSSSAKSRCQLHDICHAPCIFSLAR